MSDSIWKKEISFGRKRDKADEPAPPQPADEAPKQSIWKKEISFGRKHKDVAPEETAESLRVKELAFQRRLEEAAQVVVPAPAPEPVVEAAYLPVPVPQPEPEPEPAPAPVAEPESIWKKEISFRRKPAETPAGPVEAAEVETPVAEPGSIWKKEIGFRRKPAETPAAPAVEMPAAQAVESPAEEPAPAPVEEVASPQSESIWKKEIHLRRKPVEAAAAPAGEEAADDSDAEQPVSIWKKEIHLRRRPGDPHTRGDSIWTRDISLRRREARREQVRALAEEALAAIGPEPEQDEMEPWETEPQLPPEPAPDVAKAVDPAAPKQSIWKREIGKPKPKAKKSGDEPKEAKPKRRLRDVQITLPKRAARSHGSSHPVKRLVGLKVGASQLAAARIVNNGAAELAQVARQPLDQGVVVGGEVRDPEALSLALKQFFAKNKLPKKNVRLGIASNRIGVRIFDLVGIDDERQLENAIRFRAQETLPIPLDEAVLDYHVLGESQDEDGTTMQRVLLVVAYRELVERYVSACKKAGITLSGVDLEAFALLRSLAAPRPEETDDQSALVAVAIGHDRSTFAVSDGRICEFTRVIEWGGATLSVAIARALDLAPSEVEQLKRLVSLESPAVPDGISPEQYSHAVDAVRRQVQAFARELVSSLQFYQHQPGSLGIGEIVITGGTAGLAGLAAELQNLIGVRVRVGDPLARLKVPKKLALDEELGSYAIAIGLGIED